MTINGSTNNQNWTFKLEAYETSYSIENNTSITRVDMYLGRASTRSYLGGNWNGNITVDGQIQYLSGNIPYPTYVNGGDWLYLGTKEYTVVHNTTGDKTVGISASFSSSDFSPSSAWASGELQLTTIPRASSITATNTDIGSATSININRASSNFKHTLRYSFGSLSGTISSNIDTSYGWIVPNTFYAQIPNAKTGICTIYCDTYSGSTLIGTKSTTFTVTANENLCKPTITGSVIDINEDTIDLTNDNTVIVKYRSTARVTYSATAQNSATISNVKINNVTVTNGTYDFENTQSTEFEIIATDSRGYSTTLLLQPTAIDYIETTMNATVVRTAPTTGQVSVSFSGNYFNDTFGNTLNELNIGYFYKEKDSQNWLYGGRFVENTDYIITNNTYHSGTENQQQFFVLNNTFDYTKIYEIRMYFSDKLTSAYTDFTIAKGEPVFNWGDDYFNINGELQIYGQNINSYSTSEIVIGTYKNKILYRQVIETVTALSNNYITLKSNIDEISKIFYEITTLDTKYYFGSLSGTISTYLYNGDLRLKTEANSDWIANKSIAVVLEYTKIVD